MDDHTQLAQFESQFSPMGIKREYVDLCGDLATASLLAQIVYWYLPSKTDGKSKLRVFRDDHFWIAKTRAEWMAECCLTERKYRRALETLIAKKLVETRVMKFRGLTTTHLRLNLEVLTRQLIRALRTEVVSKPDRTLSTVRNGQKDQSAFDKTSSPYTERTAGNTAEITVLGCASLTPGQKECGNTDKAKSEAKKRAIQGLKYGECSPNNVIALWTSLMAGTYGVSPTPSLTGKDRGQLVQCRKRWGESTAGVLKYAVQNWPSWTSEAQCERGEGSRAIRPHIGYLLAHQEIVHRLYMQSISKNAVLVSAIPKAVVDLKSLKNEPEPVTLAQPMTDEEFDQLLEAVKQGKSAQKESDSKDILESSSTSLHPVSESSG